MEAEPKKVFEHYSFRCHNLHLIMKTPRAKGEVLSEGAKTELTKLVSQYIYGYDVVIDARVLDKGIRCEDDAIQLLNDVRFENYVKNTERFTNDWLTGEPDIITENKVIDIKNAWSLATFPILNEQVADKDEYEWQVRAYMMLTKKPFAEVAYCLVDTPEDLIKYENPHLHIVSHIPQNMRVTIASFERDKELEELIKAKVVAAREFMETTLRQMLADHEF